MKKLIAVFLAALVLVSCGVEESGKGEKEVTEEKEIYISDMDIFYYLRELLDPYTKLKETGDEEEVFKALEGMDKNTRKITNELKDIYEDSIVAVNDLEELADTLEDFVKDSKKANSYLIEEYGQEIDRLVYTISTYYLDGFLPTNYSDMKGINNIH